MAIGASNLDHFFGFMLRRSAALLAASGLLGLATLSLGADSAAAADVTCDRVAAITGSDAAAGTVEAPFQTPAKLIGSLSPGQTGCLRGGEYVATEYSIATPNVRITSYPGERATLRGRLRIEPTADNAVVENLDLDGRNPNDWLGPLIYADHAVLRGNDITNHHDPMICVHVDDFPGYGPPEGVVIEDNRIHDCGVPGSNMHHGVYLAVARGTVIRNNVIYDNADRGIQLYPDADGSRITGNVIDGNGEGVLFGGDGTLTSDDNLVEGNVITNSRLRYNVESSFPGPIGTGNVARDNCVWGGVYGDSNGGTERNPRGYALAGNIVSDPLYTARSAADYTLRPESPCTLPDAGEPSPDASDPAPSSDLRIELSPVAKRLRVQQRIQLTGRVRGASPRAGQRAIVQTLRHGTWRRFANVAINAHGRFRVRSHTANTARVMRFRAEVAGGSSRTIRVRVRRH
jgi:parallel beta-helix repeat protein